MGSGVSFNIDDYPLEERKAVLEEKVSLEGIAEYIKAGKAKNIVVVMGAGSSVSAGIPDFRTPGTGLYDNLDKYNLPKPESIFDLEFFKGNPAPFYLLAKEIYPGSYEPTPTHRFLKLLDDKGLLRRVYTQNIDGLEALAGLAPEKVVQCHGGFSKGHCIKCGHVVDSDWLKGEIFSGRTPVKCPKCSDAANGEEEDIPPYVKPQITFFGENLPRRFFECKEKDLKAKIDLRSDVEIKEHESMRNTLNTLKQRATFGLLSVEQTQEMEDLREKVEIHDRKQEEASSVECPCDLMLVIGTSLQVQPVAGLPDQVEWNVPRVLFNREPVHVEEKSNTGSPVGFSGFRFYLDDNYRDVFVGGDCDDGVGQLTQLLDWSIG